MELVPYIISILSLTIVIFQFAIKRKDEKTNFILNKKYDLYLSFLKEFEINRLRSEFSNIKQKYHIEYPNLIGGDSMVEIIIRLQEALEKGGDFNIILKQWREIIHIFYKKEIDLNQFMLLGSQELFIEIDKFMRVWSDYRNIFAMFDFDEVSRDAFIAYLKRIDKTTEEKTNIQEQLSKSLVKINIIMRKELDISKY